MFVPRSLIRQLYTVGSLRNTELGIEFSVKNRLIDAELTRLRRVRIDGEEVPLDRVRLRTHTNGTLSVETISEVAPLPFPLRETIDVLAADTSLPSGNHEIEIAFDTRPFGRLTLEVDDAVDTAPAEEARIPRCGADDYALPVIRRRQRFAEEYASTGLDHIKRFSFDPHLARGNCEHFTGVAQVPLGLAGPLRVEGEHARGEFLIPLATAEGTLVASYNRGIKVLNAAGGVKCTVVASAMQRAPVFVFADAREAREFATWVAANHDAIREPAESTSRVARLTSIESYQSNRFVFLRLGFRTGDAAGQNMVSRATLAACSWIADRYPGIERFFLEANMATDKKASLINTLHTRGRRVTAEAVIPCDVLVRHLRVEPQSLVQHHHIANIGAMLSGANNNGLHSANAIAALFIATGQDTANVAESSTGLIFSELTATGDLYLSITLPSLIVATHGGGTGLATQSECLALLGCRGPGKVDKLAEIIAGVVLAGEISLASAISSLEWVSSHEQFGRNR